MSASSNTQMLSIVSKSMKQIEELGRLCYQNNIEKKDIFLMDQIIKRNMSAEVQYLLDHKLSVNELEYAYRAKGFLVR